MSENQTIAAALAAARARIAAACAAAGRDPEEVTVMGVTKKFGPEVVAEAWEAGVRLLGENRVQEAAFKIPLCVSGPEWHFVGHLQRNKVRHVLALFSTIHSVDSLRLVEQIEAEAQAAGLNPNIMLEINVAGESSKFGLKPTEAAAVLERALECRNLTVVGLMTMAPFHAEAEKTRPVFARLRALRDALQRDLGVDLPHLSMGMSNDFDVAVAEGATIVRLGTLLFGGRPTMNETMRAQMAADNAWEE